MYAYSLVYAAQRLQGVSLYAQRPKRRDKNTVAGPVVRGYRQASRTALRTWKAPVAQCPDDAQQFTVHSSRFTVKREQS